MSFTERDLMNVAGYDSRMPSVFILVILALGLTVVDATAWAGPRGCIVAWSGNTPFLQEVDLLPWKSGDLGNDLLSIDSSAAGVRIDLSQSLCFPVTDQRLLLIDLYAQASRELEFYNQIMGKIGIKPLTGVRLVLKPVSATPLDDDGGGANGKKNTVNLNFRGPLFDSTIYLHEIGHLIQHHLENQSGIPHQTAENPEMQTVGEAFADLMVAFFTGQTMLFEHTLLCEPSRDIQDFVRRPDVARTYRQVIDELINGEGFSRRCPKTLKFAKMILSGQIPVALDQEEPHYMSRLISRPVWRAFIRFPQVRGLVFRTIISRKIETVRDFAEEILRLSQKDTALYKFLFEEFTLNGVL
jgi:hypothetical protein